MELFTDKTQLTMVQAQRQPQHLNQFQQVEHIISELYLEHLAGVIKDLQLLLLMLFQQPFQLVAVEHNVVVQ